MRKMLFKAKFTGATNNHFIHDNFYSVVEVDQDGDYIVIDEFMNEISEYKSKFEEVIKVNKIEVRGNTVISIERAIRNHLKEVGFNNRYDTFRHLMVYNDKDVIDLNAQQIVVYVHSGSNEGWYVIIGTLKVMTFNELWMIRVHESLEAAIAIQNEILQILEV